MRNASLACYGLGSSNVENLRFTLSQCQEEFLRSVNLFLDAVFAESSFISSGKQWIIFNKAIRKKMQQADEKMHDVKTLASKLAERIDDKLYSIPEDGDDDELRVYVSPVPDFLKCPLSGEFLVSLCVLPFFINGYVHINTARCDSVLPTISIFKPGRVMSKPVIAPDSRIVDKTAIEGRLRDARKVWIRERRKKGDKRNGPRKMEVLGGKVSPKFKLQEHKWTRQQWCLRNRKDSYRLAFEKNYRAKFVFISKTVASRRILTCQPKMNGTVHTWCLVWESIMKSLECIDSSGVKKCLGLRVAIRNILNLTQDLPSLAKRIREEVYVQICEDVDQACKFTCALTGRETRNPILFLDGNVYERAALWAHVRERGSINGFPCTIDDVESTRFRKPEFCRLLCPISMKVASDPVIVRDGNVYERRSILRWVRGTRGTSPLNPGFELRVSDVLEAPAPTSLVEKLDSRIGCILQAQIQSFRGF